MKCYGCGTDKDMNQTEVYSYPEDSLICDEPVEPLFVIECQKSKGTEYRACIVCHECFHRLQPDMWISQGMWEELNPIIPYADLPPLIMVDRIIKDKQIYTVNWDASKYPELVQ